MVTICQWCHLEHWDELSRDRAGEQRAALYGATRVQDTQGTQGTHATGTLRHLSWVAWPLTQWEHAGAGHCVLRTTVTSSEPCLPSTQVVLQLRGLRVSLVGVRGFHHLIHLHSAPG